MPARTAMGTSMPRHSGASRRPPPDELTNDAPRRPEWKEHQARARSALGAAGQDLLRKLAFAIDRLDNFILLLKGADRRLALAVLLDQTEVPESGSARFSNLSPVSYAFTKADSELRLYPTRTDIGVGRRGRTETYVRNPDLSAKRRTRRLSDAVVFRRRSQTGWHGPPRSVYAIGNARNKWLEENLPARADGQVRRAAAKLGLIAGCEKSAIHRAAR